MDNPETIDDTQPISTEVYQESEPVLLESDAMGRQYFKTEKGIILKDGDYEIAQLKLGLNLEKKVAAIHDIGVNKEYHRQGIGSKLVVLAEQVASESGIEQMQAMAQPDMLALLKKNGYSTNGFFASKKLESKIAETA